MFLELGFCYLVLLVLIYFSLFGLCGGDVLCVFVVLFVSGDVCVVIGVIRGLLGVYLRALCFFLIFVDVFVRC